ncbi:hypothetical protein EV363DRAFT_820647 [Boletus edulis]|nr:hypothetical protein EV363DRAFT_820647 [Boletus edulis]
MTRMPRTTPSSSSLSMSGVSSALVIDPREHSVRQGLVLSRLARLAAPCSGCRHRPASPCAHPSLSARIRYRGAVDSELKPSNYGQPLFYSHPHLLRPHELTPGIPVEEYEQRR